MADDAPRSPGRDDIDRIVFVYNVDGTPVAFLKDAYLGFTTGSTDCHLCDLTFGKILKDRGWARFVAGLPYDVDFQLRSTFTKHHPEVQTAFPAAFVDRGGVLEQVLSADAIDAAEDLEALRTLVTELVERLQARELP